ncbi:MAG: ROK family protein [Armatimonadota bacterium]|nr:ROK family protein [Armatimonadota bacterium]
MSFPNVCRLVAKYKNDGLLIEGEQQKTGRRGPWSRAIAIRGDVGCCIGVDLEATNVRGVALDFSNKVTDVLRQPITPSDGPDEIIRAVTQVASGLVKKAKKRKNNVYAIGLGLPGPVIDKELGRVRTHLQFGYGTLEFVPAVQDATGVRTSATANTFCFAVGHHRMNTARGKGIEMIILNRFGIAATVIWNGNLYTGASHYAGDIGLLPCNIVSPARPLKEVCTGASLLRFAQERGDQQAFQDLLVNPNQETVIQWLEDAVPAFAQAIYFAVMLYNPDRVLIEGIFNGMPAEVRDEILTRVKDEVMRAGNMIPEINFFEGDDLMGARGAAMLARDEVADEIFDGLISTS